MFKKILQRCDKGLNKKTNMADIKLSGVDQEYLQYELRVHISIIVEETNVTLNNK